MKKIFSILAVIMAAAMIVCCFSGCGKMQILSPKNVNEEYRKRLTDALKRST